MGVLDCLALGWNISTSISNLGYCFLGVFLGTLIGVLPGIGPPVGIALLLPFSFGIDPTSAIILLSGIYYGASYGGSTTSILVNIPGAPASVVTCLDGYQMARQGRAGPALGISAMGSFIAGTLGIILLMFLALPLSTLALRFGPPEYVGIMILGLAIAAFLSRGSMLKSIIMVALGVAISLIGTDMINGKIRFTFGIMELEDGIGLVPLVVGLFGIGEVLINIEKSTDVEILRTKIKGLLPNLEDWRNSIGPILRGTFLGFFLGILPGGGAVLSSFVSYGIEKKISRHPEKFGTGMIEGVAGPESANNSATAGAYIPLFMLGIPSNVVTALLLGALMIHGLQPGPMLLSQNPEIFWGTVVSMYIGNIMLIILNLPLIGLWVKVLKIPHSILFTFVIFFCILGTYTDKNSISDVIIMLAFGFIGYLFKKFEYDPAPLVLASILTPFLENGLRQSLIMSEGSFLIFLNRPIAAGAFIITIALLSSSIIPQLAKRRKIIANVKD